MALFVAAATVGILAAAGGAASQWVSSRGQPFIKRFVPSRLPKRTRWQLLREQPTLLSLFSLEKRHSQLKTLVADPASIEIAATEVWLNHNLAVSGASFGLAVAGTLFFPPLRLLSIPGLLYGLLPIYAAAYRTIVEERRSGVDALYAFTHTIVIANGLLVVGNLGTVWFFLSRKLQLMARERFQHKLRDIFAETPLTVFVKVDGGEVEQPLANLQIGDRIIVQPGQTILVDGVITEGMASIDEHGLTGEFQPAEKTVGEQVFASTLIHTGCIVVRVQQSGESTITAKIQQILDNTVEYKTGQRFSAETLTDRSVIPIVALGAASLPFIGPSGSAAIIGAHPHRRMITSASLSVLSFVSMAAEQGVLIKDGRTLEMLGNIDTVVFDKTGTLTLDQPHVKQIHPCPGHSEKTILAYAAAAETRQSHPIAKAIIQAAERYHIPPAHIDESDYHMGYGLSVRIDGLRVRVGSPRFLRQEGIRTPATVEQTIDAAYRHGTSVVLVAINDEVAGVIELQATIRPEVQQVVSVLRQQNLSLHIISGDHAEPTRTLAENLGIDHYAAEILPVEKAQLVKQLQAAGKSVCFVGDGINDTVAMKEAHVSVALRGATTAAIDTAHVVLMHENLSQLVPLFELERAYRTNNRATMLAILGPATVAVSGALFFGTGLAFTELMNQGGFPLSAAAAMGSRWWRQIT